MLKVTQSVNHDDIVSFFAGKIDTNCRNNFGSVLIDVDDSYLCNYTDLLDKKSEAISYLTKNTSYFYKNREKYGLSELGECHTCNADRNMFPLVRQSAENLVLKLSKEIQGDTLVITDFANFGMFQLLVIIQKIMEFKKLKNIEIHSIDHSWGKLIFQELCQVENNECMETINLKLFQFINWFKSQINIKLYLYPHYFEYYYFTQIHPEHKPDILLGIDYLDEIGMLNRTSIDFYCLCALTMKQDTKVVSLISMYKPQLSVISLRPEHNHTENTIFKNTNPTMKEIETALGQDLEINDFTIEQPAIGNVMTRLHNFFPNKNMLRFSLNVISIAGIVWMFNKYCF